MPHIVLEYSADLEDGFDPRALLRRLHEEVGSTESFQRDRVKSRAVPRDPFLVGEEPATAMVHATVAFSPGRTDELRSGLGDRLLALLVAGTERLPAGRPVVHSVEIRQFEPGGYFTSQPGTAGRHRAPAPADGRP